jgi:hypothetical protein
MLAAQRNASHNQKYYHPLEKTESAQVLPGVFTSG